MASEEAKFAARADRLAGRQGVAGFMPASARAAQPAPTNRYICLLYTSDAADD